MYAPFKTFIYRTPLLPFGNLKQVLNHPKDIENWMKNDRVREAVYLASPILLREIEKYLSGQLAKEKERKKVVFSFLKYFSRMCSRCTPFGLFATCSSGEIGEHTYFQIGEKIERVTRLDMLFLCAMAQQLVTMPEIRDELRYYPNSTLYPVGKHFHYVEYKYIKDRKVHVMASVEKNRILTTVLHMASTGVTIDKLHEYLSSLNFPKQEIVDYVSSLINSQILVEEWDAIVTGESYAHLLLSTLQRMNLKTPTTMKIRESLKDTENLLTKLDCEELGKPIDVYRSCTQKLSSLQLPVNESFLFQVDSTRKGGRVSLGKEIIGELEKTIMFLHKMFPEQPHGVLSVFKQHFYERYEFREVPLAMALDPSIGIGYPSSHGIADISPLVDQLVLPKNRTQNTQGAYTVNPIILKKICEMAKNKEPEILLTDEDVKDIAENTSQLPSTVYVVCQLLQNPDGQSLLNIKTVGSNAANLLS